MSTSCTIAFILSVKTSRTILHCWKTGYPWRIVTKQGMWQLMGAGNVLLLLHLGGNGCSFRDNPLKCTQMMCTLLCMYVVHR